MNMKENMDKEKKKKQKNKIRPKIRVKIKKKKTFLSKTGYLSSFKRGRLFV